MQIVVIDAQGGGIGRQLTAQIRSRFPEAEIIAAGTNSIATSAMLKAGASVGATGENAVAVCAGRADVIVGPIGIVLADSMYGEITAAMAAAVARSRAKRILLPLNHCDTYVAGTKNGSIAALIADAMQELEKLME